MHVLALNCGSSSVKSALIDTERRQRLLDLRVENIGTADCRVRINNDVRALPENTDLQTALAAVLEELQRLADSYARPAAVAHRVVHGGERFLRTTQIDDAMLGELEKLSPRAPLHNPPAIAAIRVARQGYPELPQVAVFDTAYHATLPRRAREYALPRDVRERFGIRRYGFHGINHEHVMNMVAAHLRTSPGHLRIVSCHLGNGASVTAIEYGRSVDTSMGMTPLEGLVMGTRGGDLDPGALLELLHSGEFDADRLDALLNRQSGLTGLAGTHDMRQIELRAAAGDEECRLALALYSHRVRKYIGAYAAIMGGVDVIAMTGGVGENSALIRHRCLQRLEFLGAVLDEDRNRDVRTSDAGFCREISEERSRTQLLVVRADEELAMAVAAEAILGSRAARQRLRIPIAVSARHAHLAQATIEKLFGEGHALTVAKRLSQPGQFAAAETVTLIGPCGRLEHVRLMGPPRQHDQIELSRSDEFVLGIDAPVRLSGELGNTPGITIEGPAGRVTLASGVICARRHIHMNAEDARRLGVSDHDAVAVRIDSADRDLVFNDVTVRIAPNFNLELHLDTDEANAAGVLAGAHAELILHGRGS